MAVTPLPEGATQPQLNKALSKPRRVTIMGATGSVGCSTIDLIERHRESYEVEALTANTNVELLAEQARRLRARIAVVADASRYKELREALAGSGIEAAAGPGAGGGAAGRPAGG